MGGDPLGNNAILFWSSGGEERDIDIKWLLIKAGKGSQGSH